MAKYSSGHAREWAMAELAGVCGCVLPTMKASMAGLNEGAIRHDVRREKKLGFAGILLVSEAGTTPAEMRQFIDVAVDEAGDDLVTVVQASEPTLEANVELLRYAEAAGVDLVLLSYPLTFYPVTEQEVYDYTAAVARATGLGIILFAINMWNFGRLHPSGFSPSLIGRLIDEIPNICMVKAETGAPGMAGIGELFHRFHTKVVVAEPMERNAPLWTATYGMKFMGTSNYEYYGAEVPRYFDLLQKPDTYDEAMAIYWRLHPARIANGAIGEEYLKGTHLVHRIIWKFQGWLQGFNGGPIRHPQMRISDHQMNLLTDGLRRSGFDIGEVSFRDFFIGRNPE